MNRIYFKVDCQRTKAKVRIGKLMGSLILMTTTIAPTAVWAEDLASPNYKMLNANLGEQPFITSKEVSPPAVTGPGPEIIDLQPYSAKIKWFTDKSANSIVQYGTSSGKYDKEISHATEYITSHEIELTNLTPKTTYYYTAKSTDLYGNMGTSTARSFTTPLPIPKVTNIKVNNVTSNSASVIFKTDYFTTAVVEYINTKDLTKKTVGETGYTKDHEVKLTDLIDECAYSYRIIVHDDEGNESSTSSAEFITAKDQTPPSLAGMKFDINPITGKDNARVIVYWRSDEPSTSRVRYIEGASGDKSSSETLNDQSLVTNHIVTLSNLKPQTTYRVQAISMDKAGNEGKTDEFLILTPKQKRTLFQLVIDNLEEIFMPFVKILKKS